VGKIFCFFKRSERDKDNIDLRMRSIYPRTASGIVGPGGLEDATTGLELTVKKGTDGENN
jgi:hypothetical protein